MKKIMFILASLLAILIISSSSAIAAGLSIGSKESDTLYAEDTGSETIFGSSDPVVNNPSVGSDDSLITNSNNGYLVEDASANIISKFSESIEVNQIVNFEGQISDPGSLDISYKWDFGDGKIISDVDIGQSVTVEASHAYTQSGEYVVKLYIIKNDKAISEDNIVITVDDIESNIDAGGPYYGLVNENICFGKHLIGPSLVDDDIISYIWDFGDGTSCIGKVISHRYGEVGSYIAKLTTEDQDGNIETDTAVVNVVKITVNIHPSNPAIGEEVNLGVEVVGFKPTEFNWKFGDEKFDMDISSSRQSVTHKYLEEGTYYGSISFGNDCVIEQNFMIPISNINKLYSAKPVSSFSVTPNFDDTSTLFEFDASNSYDIDSDIAYYEWYFGDGNMIITKSEKCKYAFEDEGNWDAHCIVVSKDGGFDSSNKIIQVDSADNNEAAEIVNNQKGMLFFRGDLKSVEMQEAPEEDSSDIINSKQCDLEINVNKKEIKSNDSFKLEIAISDLSGDYDSEEVNIQLISDIPGYELVSYSVKKTQGSDDFHLDIEIPSVPDDSDSSKISVAIVPDDGYIDSDWSGNKWSFTDEDESDSISSRTPKINDNFSLKGFIFGNIAI